MPRRRLIPERPLTVTERVRRHRLRKRGIEPPPAPARLPGLGDELGLLDLRKFMEGYDSRAKGGPLCDQPE
jgi:hypothetical protein